MSERPSPRSHRGSAEHGASMVLLAISAAVLFGFLALAFDFGRMYAERRELQGGADAAALAIAQDCARNDCGIGYDEFGVAETYADENATDGFAWVPEIDIDLNAQQVTVHTATEDPGGDNHFDMTFAQIVGYGGLTVGAEATVAWGSPGRLATLPITFSLCEWLAFGENGYVNEGGSLHYTQAYRDDLFIVGSGYQYAERLVQIFFHGNHQCTGEELPSGQDLPGGFGWLTTDGECASHVQVYDWVGIDPGASPSTGCEPEVVENLLGQVVLLPYFDDYRSTGSNAEYRIAGFGAFYITGYNFAGQYREPSIVTGEAVCVGEDRCIEGYLIGDWVATDGELGGPDDFGVVIVKLIG